MRTKEELKELVNRLTLDEKIGMVHGCGLFCTKAVERLDIPEFIYSDGPMGVRPEYQKTQWFPVGRPDDLSTYLPSNSATAATFSRENAREVGRILGQEARGRGKDMILAPGVNIVRAPLCGRNFEYMSEDPCLTSELAVSYIEGVQENDVSACVKHYALNNQETRRSGVDVSVSERALREIYLPAFKAAVTRANAHGIMASYNRFRGYYTSHSKYLIDEILRGEWGFDKILVSDWGSITDTVEAGNVGIDVDMRVTDNFDDYYFGNPLKKAIEEGKVDEKKLDEKIFHILRTMDELNMLPDADGNMPERKSGTYNAYGNREILKRISAESIVLLKNEGKLLPIDKKKVKKALVIGDNGIRQHAYGGGSAEIKALFEIPPLLGIRMNLGGACEVSYEPGWYNYVIGNAWGKDVNGQWLGNVPNEELSFDEIAKLDEKYLEDAKKAAKEADVVIFSGGLNHDHDVEGKDREDYHLPNHQDDIIKELLKVRPDMIITLIAGSPFSVREWIDDAKAVITYSYGGMETGAALADVLFGDENPSGKLPVTFPKELKDCPAYALGEFPGGDTVDYKEGIYVGYRYYEKYGVKPEFAFGHGLSYTQFEFGEIAAESEGEGGDVKVYLPVKNTGERDGKCTVLFFVKPLDDCGIDRPVKELKGFDRKELKVGETAFFTAKLDGSAFSVYDEENKCFKIVKGRYEVIAAYAADDERSRTTVEI
ncbi:MAG TPA: glycosyl hydrolase [Lachnospiraceae bacterium]|nr:glycosyl hydrolase [Lachnospiraceae bacterium]